MKHFDLSKDSLLKDEVAKIIMSLTIEEQIIEEFEKQGEGRVRFIWERREAKQWLREALKSYRLSVLKEVEDRLPGTNFPNENNYKSRVKSLISKLYED